MSVHSISIDHSGKVEPKRADAVIFPQRFHPLTCPHRGDGKHTEREGRDLGELSWDAERKASVCLDCDYVQEDAISIQAKRYQAASALARLEAWKSGGKGRHCHFYHTDCYDSTGWCCDLLEGVGKTAQTLILISGPNDEWGCSLSATINRALDAWEAKP